MTRQVGFALFLPFLLPACSTAQYTPGPPSASESGVRVLYRYPHARYTTLGTFDFAYYYRPGSREPSLADALPSLREDVSSAGGNAFIVRDEGTCSHGNRCVSISAEVLRVDWSTPGRVQR